MRVCPKLETRASRRALGTCGENAGRMSVSSTRVKMSLTEPCERRGHASPAHSAWTASMPTKQSDQLQAIRLIPNAHCHRRCADRSNDGCGAAWASQRQQFEPVKSFRPAPIGAGQTMQHNLPPLTGLTRCHQMSCQAQKQGVGTGHTCRSKYASSNEKISKSAARRRRAFGSGL